MSKCERRAPVPTYLYIGFHERMVNILNIMGRIVLWFVHLWEGIRSGSDKSFYEMGWNRPFADQSVFWSHKQSWSRSCWGKGIPRCYWLTRTQILSSACWRRLLGRWRWGKYAHPCCDPRSDGYILPSAWNERSKRGYETALRSSAKRLFILLCKL